MSPARRRPQKRSGAPQQQAQRGGPASNGVFWGTDTTIDDPIERIPMPDDPTVIVRSLGPVPLQNREAHAERYFAAVYEKAAALGAALAATVDLLDTGQDTPGSDDAR